MSSVDIGYRRNGKKQACEPCRKGKIACDHGFPHCGRCVRLKNTEKCSYHPAPMTRGSGSRTPTTSKIQAPPRAAVSHSSSSPSSQSFLAGQYQSVGVQTDDRKEGCTGAYVEGQLKVDFGYPRKSQANWKQATYPRSSRFYGETSFKAMFAENQTNMGELFLDDSPRKHPGSPFQIDIPV